MQRFYAILDDNGFVHNNMDETSSLIAWGILITPQLLKTRLSPEEFERAEKDYLKETKGTLHLARVLASYPAEETNG